MGDLLPDKSIGRPEWQTIDDDETLWQDDHSIPEQGMDLDQSETEREGAHEHEDSRLDILPASGQN